MSGLPDLFLWLTAALATIALGGALSARFSPRIRLDAGKSVALAGGIAVLLAGLLIVILGPGTLALVALIGTAAAATLGVFWVRFRLRPSSGPVPDLVFLALIVLADLLLGASLAGAGSLVPFHGVPSSWTPALSIVVGPAFLVAVAVQIGAVGVLSRPDLDPRVRGLIVGQAAILLLSPTLVASDGWSTLSAYLGAAVFVALFVLALQFIYRTKQLAPSLSRLLVRWSVASTLTACGWFVWHLYGDPAVLAVSVGAQCVVGLASAIPPRSAVPEVRLPWLLHPFWVFEILLFIFLSQFFLGALLDLQIAGPAFLQFIPFLPYSGTSFAAVGTAIYNGLWFGAAILASAWFLIVMGFAMGALVVFKMRETRERALRYRLGLMIAVYALAAIYIPSLASSTPITTSSTLANLPIVGWGFGLRSGGPFESTAFAAILFMYAFVGVMTVLFGRKALCSVMCGAALLYQGTTVSEMRGFNQTSRVGKYFLGSQLSTAYLVASSLALISLFATSVLGVLHMLPAVTLANGEVDTSALPLPVELYFGGLWFAMFVSVPYVGTYNCATTGFCHWGALSIPFAKFGMFRLKVKDRKVCQACTTFDCAKACPVGLVDMPLYFRTTGEYRSTKCCGVGDCVGACPYGNMYHQDVRFWLRRRGSPSPVPPVSNRLPMVASTLPSSRSAEPSVAPSTTQL